jgi:phenylalanine-4-hydroxylase
VLFAGESFAHVQDVIGSFWSTCDDDSIAALRAA